MKVRSVVFGVSLALAATATATADSPNWTATRVLDCGGAGTLNTALNPGGFGTPYHLANSTRLLVPRRVTVNGIVVITQPGVDQDANQELVCSYTDPAGLEIVVEGILTP